MTQRRQGRGLFDQFEGIHIDLAAGQIVIDFAGQLDRNVLGDRLGRPIFIVDLGFLCFVPGVDVRFICRIRDSPTWANRSSGGFLDRAFAEFSRCGTFTNSMTEVL